ncbi:hypothetical protein [Pseudomonas sp. 5P_3.1_Bac2]|uniref:hypothetical protein n=1 Tax=Pseudomonas sp. 5P_3.1_Bac2 TaxID=2971617 RepID=UPI0021C92427|nr:hypothetical protein [Pseudomonas sp. 5P_3.1_Bac2]MCU1719408.1 hypothetical protein [Pseudomonas sp. 5P_3.1_Bac2]
MLKALVSSLAIVLLAGCGHSNIGYSPSAGNMTWDQAVAIVERGFHEDYGDQKTQSILITDKAIVLSDGSITTGSYSGTAIPVYGAAVVIGASNSKTIAAGQHIYLDTLLPSMVMKKNMREGRFAVIIRQSPGFTARRVFFRTQSSAEIFSDALEVLRAGHGVPIHQENTALSKDQYKQQLIQQLNNDSPPYEEYVRRMREIESM